MFSKASDAASAISGVISEKHQQGYFATDLTVAEVHEVTGSGAVDFGGSEEERAPRKPLGAQKQNPDDDYGWWELPAGAYVFRCNERLNLSEGGLAFVQPHPRLIRAGAYHPSIYLSADSADQASDSGLEITVTVGARGIRIKENARVSQLFLTA
jgi:deoxycytidine triphosphate deaminase